MTGTKFRQIRGLFKTYLTGSDPDRSIAFCRDTLGLPLGLPLALSAPERHAASFRVPQPGQGLLGLWSIHTSPIRLKLHMAFMVSLDEIRRPAEALRASGLVPPDFEKRPADGPVVVAWVPAASIYSNDPAGHLLGYPCMLDGPPRSVHSERSACSPKLEYPCMLDGPPRPEWGVVPYSAWPQAAPQ